MNKLIKALCLSIFLSVSIFAQTTTDTVSKNNFDTGDSNKPTTGAKQTTSAGYNKNEYYIGYSNQQVDDFSRSTFHGFEAAYVRNVHRYFGIRGSVSGAYKNESSTGTFLAGTTTNTFSFESKRRIYNFLGGVQVKDNASTKRLKPFGFALAGIAVNTNRGFSTFCATCTTAGIITTQFFRSSDVGLAGAFGGGLDIKINDKIDFRAIQVDYNPIYSNTRVDNNFRFGVGVVFK